MKLYFSHPTLTFRTKTEEISLEVIKDSLEPDEIVNPADYGLKDDLRSMVREADAVVGMAIEDKFTFLVWNEMDEGQEHGADLYTIKAKNKENVGILEEGFPEGTSKLNREESESFTSELLKENRSRWLGLLFGNWGSKF